MPFRAPASSRRCRPHRDDPLARRTPGGLSVVSLVGLLAVAAGCGEVKVERRERNDRSSDQTQTSAPERHLDNVRALTSGGVNRQASFSADGRLITWQSRSDRSSNFQVMVMNTDGTDRRQLSPGNDRCEGPCFLPDGSAVLFASVPETTTTVGDQSVSRLSLAMPASPDSAVRQGQESAFGWLFDPGYDVCRVSFAGGPPTRLTASAGYDAEVTTSWGGARLLFTSFRDGTPGLYQMNADGSDQTLVLRPGGYVGGARISPDGERIVFHAAPVGGKGLEVFIAGIDGSNPTPLTAAGAVSFGPCWHPSGEFLLFSSNMTSWDYELYSIRPDGTDLERVTHSQGFDAFPAFSRDGRQLLWTSQRAAAVAGETQIYRAAWLP